MEPIVIKHQLQDVTPTTKKVNAVAEVAVAAKAGAKSKAVTKADVQLAWNEYQTTEKHGIELGRVLFEYRDSHKSKGGHGSQGSGLVQLLNELGIAHSTAYWWLNRYEVSLGLKQAKPNQVANAQATVSSEPDVEPNPEPNPVREPWDRSKERWKGRNDPPITDDAEIERLALKLVTAGYKALMAADGDGEYRTHLWRAQEEAKNMIRAGFGARASSPLVDQLNRGKGKQGEVAL
ncbi:MAG: hypothetical protein P4M04_02940 [Acidobacteriota bacterium]|nr:hypothetical protein [Acidobacteriota bacterium]